MPRITPADEKNNPPLAKAYEQITKTRGFVSDILKVFSHAPEGLERFAAFGEYVRYRTDLPARTREFAILAIARGNQTPGRIIIPTPSRQACCNPSWTLSMTGISPTA